MEITYLITQRGAEWTSGDNCDFIEEHCAAGEGDKWFYDIYRFGGKLKIRIFDPVEVWFKEETK